MDSTLRPVLAPAALAAEQEFVLRDTLKRCSAETYEAAWRYRTSGDPSCIPIVVRGIIERFVEKPLRRHLAGPADQVRLSEDLGLDSLTLMEVVLLVEDVLKISIQNEELRPLRTLGDVLRFVEHKLQSPAPAGPAAAAWPGDTEKDVGDYAAVGPGSPRSAPAP